MTKAQKVPPQSLPEQGAPYTALQNAIANGNQLVGKGS